MKVRIGNAGHKDLLIQSSGQVTRAINPLSFGAKIRRDYIEFDLGDNEILVIRPRGAKDPDGIPMREAV